MTQHAQTNEKHALFPVQADVPVPTKVRLRQSMMAIDYATERLEDGWKRMALRTAWFLVDAVVRDDRGGLVLAETVLRKEMR